MELIVIYIFKKKFLYVNMGKKVYVEFFNKERNVVFNFEINKNLFKKGIGNI